MIAVDTNILVYAHREDAAWHAAANERLTALAEGREPWAIPGHCLREFLAIVTHPRIYDPPTPLEVAFDAIAAWLESPGLLVLGESPGYWDRLRDLALAGRIAGPQVYDAHIAALCVHHGVRELWSCDRDFSRFPALEVVNPLVA